MKISKHQVDVLVIMCEGQILHNLQYDVLGLEDADHNCYRIRYDTFKKLQDLNFIEIDGRPSIDVYSYSLTDNAKKFLLENHFDKVKDFIN